MTFYLGVKPNGHVISQEKRLRVAVTDPYLPTVREGVPVRPDEAADQTPPLTIGDVLLTGLGIVPFAVGWLVGIVWRMLSWLVAAVIVGFESGRG
jgi:hypothetical protein